MAVSPSWNDRAASVAETVGGTTGWTLWVEFARERWKDTGKYERNRIRRLSVSSSVINRGRGGGRSSELIGIVHGMLRTKNPVKPRGRNYRAVVARRILESYLSCTFPRSKWHLTSRLQFVCLYLRRSKIRKKKLFPIVCIKFPLFSSFCLPWPISKSRQYSVH